MRSSSRAEVRSVFTGGALVAVALISAALAWPAVTVGDDSDAARRERIAQLTPEARDALRRNFETFSKLPPAEQARLRGLHEAIARDPAAPQLHAVLARYHAWQKTISSAQLAELKSLPAEERLAKISSLVQEQERQRIRDLAGRALPQQDIDAIYAWLDTYLKRYEAEFQEKMPEELKVRLEAATDKRTAWRQQLLRYLLFRRGRGEFPFQPPTPEEFQAVLSKLTPESRKAIESVKTPEDRAAIARQWVFMTLRSKAFDPVPKEELEKLFHELPAPERERLEALPPDEVTRLLTFRYYAQRFGASPGGPTFGPGFGGFGPGGGFPGPFRGPGGGGPGSSGGPGGERSGPRDGPSRDRPGGDGPRFEGPGRDGFGPRRSEGGERRPPGGPGPGNNPHPNVSPPPPEG